MAESTQHKLDRIRPPRVQITYDVETLGAIEMKEIPFVKRVRGEEGGMVWGVEIGEFGGRTDHQVATACVEAAYLGDAKGRAVHLMGPLAKKVLRIAPPITINEAEAKESIEVLGTCFRALEKKLETVSTPASQGR